MQTHTCYTHAHRCVYNYTGTCVHVHRHMCSHTHGLTPIHVCTRRCSYHIHTLTHLLTNIKVPEVSPHQDERLSGPRRTRTGGSHALCPREDHSGFWVVLYSLAPDLARAGHAQLTLTGAHCAPLKLSTLRNITLNEAASFPIYNSSYVIEASRKQVKNATTTY